LNFADAPRPVGAAHARGPRRQFRGIGVYDVKGKAVTWDAMAIFHAARINQLRKSSQTPRQKLPNY
jgi:hypothetical protein